MGVDNSTGEGIRILVSNLNVLKEVRRNGNSITSTSGGNQVRVIQGKVSRTVHGTSVFSTSGTFKVDSNCSTATFLINVQT